MKIIIVTGGFDPLHLGHIEYINAAKSLGNFLIVGLNSDNWLTRKKGKPFLTFDERFVIMSNIKAVDKVIEFDDSDGTAIDAIRISRQMFPDEGLYFANGGDRTSQNIPELICAEQYKANFLFGVGGADKKNSSSWILKNWEKRNEEF